MSSVFNEEEGPFVAFKNLCRQFGKDIEQYRQISGSTSTEIFDLVSLIFQPVEQIDSEASEIEKKCSKFGVEMKRYRRSQQKSAEDVRNSVWSIIKTHIKCSLEMPSPISNDGSSSSDDDKIWKFEPEGKGEDEVELVNEVFEEQPAAEPSGNVSHSSADSIDSETQRQGEEIERRLTQEDKENICPN